MGASGRCLASHAALRRSGRLRQWRVEEIQHRFPGYQPSAVSQTPHSADSIYIPGAILAPLRTCGAVQVEGQSAVREAMDVPVRLTVDNNAPGGLRPGRDYRGNGHLVLLSDRLILATDQGRVLEVSASQPGNIRAPGPRMIIIEGSHPSGRARVRVEMVIDDEQAWVKSVEAL